MDRATQRRVRDRAAGTCDYCRYRADDEPYHTYQIEHVIPKQHGGSDRTTIPTSRSPVLTATDTRGRISPGWIRSTTH